MRPFLSITVLLFFTSVSIFGQNDYEVIHTSAAENWREASVMGNGRMGAMVEGGVIDEVIHLNEDTLWSGEPQPHHDGAHCLEALPKVRELLFKGKHKKATKLGMKTMLGDNNQCYEPLGQLKIHFGGFDADNVTDYRRSLNLNNAMVKTTFEVDGIHFSREIFTSFPDQVLVIRLTSSRPGALNAVISLDSLLEHQSVINMDGFLVMNGRAPIHATPHYMRNDHSYDHSELQKGMRFSAAVQSEYKDGQLIESKDKIEIKNSTEVVIRVSAATSYNGFNQSPSQNGKDAKAAALADLEQSISKNYNELYRRHFEDYNALFSRVAIDLGDSNKGDLSLEKRVGEHYQDGQDADLDELFYQFGRYLLISSSRLGSQPTNLQGIWSYKINPSWSSNWTINCNTQFNYIGSGAAGLGELNEPYLRMIEEGAVDGAKVAKSWYGTDGWVIHHNLDLWRAAMPVGGNVLWATFPVGGTWTVVELYDNWKFSGENNELERINKLQEGSVRFWLKNLFKHPETGKWISSPDVYFENIAKKKSREEVTLCSGPVSSTIIIKQLFWDFLESSKRLKLNNEQLTGEVEKMLPLMPDIELNKNGEIRQWHEDFKGNWGESDPTQLLAMVGAIYSNQIHPKLTPDLADALKLMLKRRGNGLDGQASWRAAFPANSYARLGQGDLAKQVIDATYKKWINPNLTTRFIQADWEIDGNLGLMGAMQECLIQSHTDEIVLLPALPRQWAAKGSVKGLRARGGFVLDFRWKDGKVTDWNIQGKEGETTSIRINGMSQQVIIE